MIHTFPLFVATYLLLTHLRRHLGMAYAFGATIGMWSGFYVARAAFPSSSGGILAAYWFSFCLGFWLGWAAKRTWISVTKDDSDVPRSRS